MDFKNSIVHDGKLVSTKNSLQVSRHKHKGTGSVNFSANSTLLDRQRNPPKKSTESQPKPDTNHGQEETRKRIQSSLAKTNKEVGSSKRMATKFNDNCHSSNTSVDSRLARRIQEWLPAMQVPRSIADWVIHQQPVQLSPGQKRALLAYFDIVPRRAYPYEVAGVITHNPLRSNEVYAEIAREPLILQCAVSIGGLCQALQRGERDSVAIAYHSARLCSLINDALSQVRTASRQEILAQAVATLALLAHLNRQYDQWQVHMKGLKQLITAAGAQTAVRPSVRWIIHKADLNGAAELAVPVHLPFPRAYPSVVELLDAETRAETREIMHRSVSACCSSEYLLELYISITMFLLVVDRGRSQKNFKVDPDVLMEEWHYNGYQFLSVPPSFQEFRSAPSMADEVTIDLRTCFCCVETCLRLGVFIYGKRINPDPMDMSQGHPRLLKLLGHQMSIILRGIRQNPRPSTSLDQEVGSFIASRNSLVHTVGPALIWLSVMWIVVSELFDGHGGDMGLEKSIFRDVIIAVVGQTAADVDALSERHLDLSRMWDLKRIKGKKWDIRETIKRVINVE